MASLLVRKLEPELIERLKKRAVAHGRSLEAEHREILRAAVEPDIRGQEIYELLRRGAVFDEEMKPEDWRLPDLGEPAEL